MQNKQLSLEEVKKIELNILVEFSKFCNQHNLKYYLAYGTLLGAIRHNGFIPWDDDIDVIMPRPDYDKFIELTGYNPIKENLETRLYKNCLHPNIYPFAKVINKNTIVYEKGKAKKNISGLWIDIFPLDGYPEDKDTVEDHFNKYMKLRHLQDLATTNPFTIRQSLPKKFIKTFFIAPFVKLTGIKNLCKKIDENAQIYSYNDFNLVSDFTWGDNLTSYIKKEELEPAVEVEFEGCKMKAPKGWKEYLTRLYGDYMQLPPEEDRIPHGFKAYKINNGYKNDKKN